MPCHPDRVRRHYEVPSTPPALAQAQPRCFHQPTIFVQPMDWLQFVSVDTAVEMIERDPGAWAPRNPYYQKTHGTVRSWFRKMRAENFAQDVPIFWTKRDWRCHVEMLWTLFDTQAVVDRETADTYNRFARSKIPWFRSTVPTSTGALTFDDIHRFIDHLTRRGDPASPGAGHGDTSAK